MTTSNMFHINNAICQNCGTYNGTQYYVDLEDLSAIVEVELKQSSNPYEVVKKYDLDLVEVKDCHKCQEEV